MKLIVGVRVTNFRSIRDQVLTPVGHLTCLAGANNAGKSNVLRALNAFFGDECEPGVPINVSMHCWRPLLKQKKKKFISISVAFDLPAFIKFRKGLESSEELLGRQFVITKTWFADDPVPTYSHCSGCDLENVDHDTPSTSFDDQRKILAFLSLITFRYIPNRVIPTDIIRQEHQALRSVLVRRLAQWKKRGETALFAEIEKAASTLMSQVESEVSRIVPSISKLRLATARSLAELIFRFGYVLREGTDKEGYDADEDEQGSGMQSLLMLQTLHMIDLDYFQQFGWRQASIWALEEPESSLHTSLEVKVADFLARSAKRTDGRLQILTTTHSDLVIQFSDQGFLAKKGATANHTPSLESTFVAYDAKSLMSIAALSGVSRWVSPLLSYPLDPIVLVEGVFDRDYLHELVRETPLLTHLRIFSLADLTGVTERGGVDDLKRYVRAHIAEIQHRHFVAPVVVLLDWDASNKVSEFEKLLVNCNRYVVLSWNERNANPRLGETFRGVERFFSDRIIDKANEAIGNKLASTPNGVLVSPDRGCYEELKKAANTIVREGLLPGDEVFAAEILNKLVVELLRIPAQI